MAEQQADNPAASGVELERQYLAELNQKPLGARLAGYVSLSGPGWLQSALTLGGGSLASSLYLGILVGTSMLWLQPLAMILGIVMLSAIAFVTLSTGERPFRAIIHHVNPVLGWGWLIASLMANMVWSLPQYALATGVMQQNLLPDLLGKEGTLGDFNSKIVIVLGILAVSILITWSYGSGHWGVRLYERMLKIIVALIVACFVGVVARLAMSAEGFSWGEALAGFIPNPLNLTTPAPRFEPLLSAIDESNRAFWSELIVSRQRDVFMSAFATAVGINMTFLLPYSMLGRGWGREHRGLAIFDLSTGMLIPFVIATSCVVIAASHQFHGVPQAGLDAEIDASLQSPGDPATGGQIGEYKGILSEGLKRKVAGETPTDEIDWKDPKWSAELEAAQADVSLAERRLAATLVKRDVAALATALEPLLQSKVFAHLIFGLGVLGMALSTITLLMLVSGFVVCEVLNLPAQGWPHRLGCLLSVTGALGPFFWKDAAAWLAVPTSVFGLTLLPIAYLTFFMMMNQRNILGDHMPQGGKRFAANLVMGLATGVAAVASAWALWSQRGKTIDAGGNVIPYGWIMLGLAIAFVVLVAVVQLARPAKDDGTDPTP